MNVIIGTHAIRSYLEKASTVTEKKSRIWQKLARDTIFTVSAFQNKVPSNAQPISGARFISLIQSLKCFTVLLVNVYA